MKYLSHIDPSELAGKRVLLRLDLNVPLNEEGKVQETDADRIRKSQASIDWLKAAGAKVLIISHIGRDPKETLAPVAAFMNLQLITSADEWNPVQDQVVLMENIRRFPGEEENSSVFAQELAAHADAYVNDAFAVSHRAHASLVGLPKLLPSYAGIQLEQEIEHLSQAFDPARPSLLVLGGAKFETKLPVIQKFLPIVDRILIGGALANNFFKEMGYETGLSLLDPSADISSLVRHPNIILPERVVVENAVGREEKSLNDVVPGDKIVDIAPAGLEPCEAMIQGSAFILWNGPMGNYENGFVEGTKKLAQMIAASAGTTIVGGGDSVALIEQLEMVDKFTFLSTGGGAMLEYLANGTLPGIEALG
jgi:3-phosphoglycerate kinase